MIYPVFQRVELRDGRVLILKTEAVCEIERDDAIRFANAAEKFRKNSDKYYAFNGDRKRIIAGLLLDFEADEFDRCDVIQWCAFAGRDLSPEEISSALSRLQADKKQPIKLIAGGGPNSRWQVRRDALASFLR